jgi:hypothetical protein
LEIKRHCQISYKSALFLMNRIRFAIAPDRLQPTTSAASTCTAISGNLISCGTIAR